MIFDAKDILSVEIMTNFLQEISSNDEVIITVGEFEKITNKYGIKNVWKSDELKNYYEAHQDQEFDIVSSNGHMMTLTHYDYVYWIESTRRINRLFKSLEEEQIAKAEEQHTVACGCRVPGKISNIHTFTGSSKQCIDFFNNELKEKTLHNVEGYTIVMCTNYVKGQKNAWQTYDELKAGGVIV